MISHAFTRFSTVASSWLGKPVAFATAVAVIVVWAGFGPATHYSEPWQIAVNTGTTIVTFLMVFLVQATQNRDAAAIHAKLDELLAVTKDARNDLIGVEKMPEEIITELRR